MRDWREVEQPVAVGSTSRVAGPAGEAAAMTIGALARLTATVARAANDATSVLATLAGPQCIRIKPTPIGEPVQATASPTA
jgi:hypothetical protein